jgi:hypothetical protein
MSEFDKNILNTGENGALQYNWNLKDYKELITQFQFQLTLSSGNNIEKLENIHKNLLYLSSPEEKKIIFKILAHTRDIVMGKGIYSLSYMMLYNYADYDFKLFEIMFNNFVGYNTDLMIPYGSWKDCKYLIEYCEKKERKKSETTKKIKEYVYSIMLKQLDTDYNNLLENKKNISLLAKWIPREKSKFKTIFHELALLSCDFNLPKINTDQYEKCIRKLNTELRKKISKINKYLKTVQINQCDKNWSQIDFSKNVTSITMIKQKKAFLNIDKKGNLRNNNPDRTEARNNLLKYIQDVSKGKEKIKAKNVDIYDYVKSALTVNDADEEKLINESWKQNGSNLYSLKNFIAMVDTSGSMECENCKPLYSAIGLGSRVAEKSSLGKRILTFSANPTWVNLEDCENFTDMIKKIKHAEWGMNTDFKKAMLKILEAIKAIKMSPLDVEQLVLVIFSDMQYDCNFKNADKITLMDYLKEEYEKAGIEIHNSPYKLPHILFWNLRSTNGFPTLSNNKNISMLSGSSSSLLNKFSTKGLNMLKDITPWKMLLDQLNEDRYNILEEYIN